MYYNCEKEYVFKDDREFKSCHASTLAVLSNDDVLVCWFGGTEEGHKDVNIWCSRRKNNEWTRPYQIVSEEGIPLWNPVLFKGDNGILYLYYKVGQTIPKWYTKVLESRDEGLTWTDPQILVENDIGGRGPVKNKPIILKNGSWLAPASTEGKHWDSFVDISTDQGKTWKKSNVYVDHSSFVSDGIIQPTLWESENGNVHMLIRTSEGFIYRSDSKDYGETWCDAYPTNLPNNNSGIDLTKLDNGRLILVYNPVSINWGPRTPLIISYSDDNGLNWVNDEALETDDGEYSYPAIVSKGNDAYISYTWNRERIVCCKITKK